MVVGARSLESPGGGVEVVLIDLDGRVVVAVAVELVFDNEVVSCC